MTARLLAAMAACVLVLPLAACNKDDNTYQGWIEAELIFVAPDELGRVQTLSVREGGYGEDRRTVVHGGRRLAASPISPRSRPR